MKKRKLLLISILCLFSASLLASAETSPYQNDFFVIGNQNYNLESSDTNYSEENTGIWSTPINDTPQAEKKSQSKKGSQNFATNKIGNLTIGSLSSDDKATTVNPEDSTSEFSYKVGDKKTIKSIKSINSIEENLKEIEIETAYIGKHCTAWIKPEDKERLNEYASTLGKYFDEEVYDQMNQYYGNASTIDVDKDGKIALVFYEVEIQASYFRDNDLLPDQNKMDMIHIDTKPNFEANNETNYYVGKSNLVHEYQHAVNHAISATAKKTSDTWLNEVFSESAIALVAPEIPQEDVIYFDSFEEYCKNKNYTPPFIFKNMFVPYENEESYCAYPQWFSFGLYILGQIDDRDFFKEILENEDGCTRKGLENALRKRGYLGEDVNATVSSFEELVQNYNIALYKRDIRGKYSFNNMFCGLPEPQLTNSKVAKIPGGGSASYIDIKGTSNTIKDAGEHIWYKNIRKIKNVTSNKPEGNIKKNTEVKLTCETSDVKIYYTLDGTEPNNTKTLYTKPIVITEDVTLRAVAYDAEKHGNTTSFTYAIESSKNDIYEDNNTLNTATKIGFPAKLDSYIYSESDIDCYSFDLDTPTLVNISLDDPSNTSYQMSLFNAKNKKLENTKNKNKKILKKLEVGTYFLQIQSEKGASADRPYTLRIQNKQKPPQKLTLSTFLNSTYSQHLETKTGKFHTLLKIA